MTSVDLSKDVNCWVDIFYSTKIEKETKKKANDAGLYRVELSGSEVAEEMEKERKIFQLHMCSVSFQSAAVCELF